ncbi:MAG: hypothetical protein RL723_191 [Actinomycetota bacterium]
MKRPQSKPATRNASGLPSAPASAARASKSSKVTKISRVPKNQKDLATRKPPKAAVKREAKRLDRLRKTRKGIGLISRLSPEAKKFTVASRRRRAVVLVVLVSMGSLLLLVLAAVFTPLLSVEKIEVGGIKRLKEKSIVNALQSQLGKPLPLVNPADVAGSLKSFPLIESFTVVSLPPHTLKIQIAERQPIGVIVVGGTRYLYDPAGVRVGIANGSENLPLINIDGAPEKSKQFKSAIDVLMALPAALLERVSEIDAKSKDDVTLRLRGYAGQRIIWGDGSDSVLKSKVLDALISNQKKSDRVTFDVSSPNAPVVRYGNF